MASFCCNPLFSQTIEVTQLIESGKKSLDFSRFLVSRSMMLLMLTHTQTSSWWDSSYHTNDPVSLIANPKWAWEISAHSVDHHHLSFTTTNKIDALWYFFPDIFSLQSSFWPFIFNFENSHFTTKISFALIFRVTW